ncbi:MULTISPECIES: hypothetical protein [Paraliobacillus]|uniref:hypothetical protein n=1 Tax=Paraliobacillus TaxID=200903 RepID=UPI000E3D6995|nr:MULTISPECIES: hypothetical protein [Paraliobacillus]
MKNKLTGYIVLIIAIISIISFGLYKWFIDSQLRTDTFIYVSFVLAYLFKYLANGETDTNAQDKKEVYLSIKALRISYLLLVVGLGITLLVTEGTSMLMEFENAPLVICFSMSIVIYPLVRAVIFLKHAKM